MAHDRLAQHLASTSLPIPWPGDAVSLAMTVRFRLFWRTISSTSAGRTHRHEPTDHQARAVRDDGHRLLKGEGKDISSSLFNRCTGAATVSCSPFGEHTNAVDEVAACLVRPGTGRPTRCLFLRAAGSVRPVRHAAPPPPSPIQRSLCINFAHSRDERSSEITLFALACSMVVLIATLPPPRLPPGRQGPSPLRFTCSVAILHWTATG